MEFVVHILRGLLGISFFLAVAYLASSNRKTFPLRIVFAGLGLQIALLLFLKLEAAEYVFSTLANWFVAILAVTEKGASLVFGPLGSADSARTAFGGPTSGVILAFQILPTIIFFSALSSVLYYLGILQKIVSVLAWIMRGTMKLSGAESFATAANVFIGQTEAPLLVKPFIPKMSKSELMALMTGGMATIAGGVMAAYVGILGGGDEESKAQFARFLLTASLLNAPAALIFAKILVPETEKITSRAELEKNQFGINILDATATGTSDGLKLALNVGAMLIVFTSLIELINMALLGFVGKAPWLGGDLNTAMNSATGYEGLTLQGLCGLLFAPVAWMMGVEFADSVDVGALMGIKLITNEFVAYQEFATVSAAGELGPKATMITTFALCGFANFASIGIQLGGIGKLAPERSPDLARLAMRALMGGTLASMLSATMAGLFFTG
ncbi:MAG: nucleoside transporter C-terminal domain-containing protein [Verrucomicrobiota bacterium]